MDIRMYTKPADIKATRSAEKESTKTQPIQETEEGRI